MCIIPSQAPNFVASCGHGKQKRSTTRKKETEETETMIVAAVRNMHRGCDCLLESAIRFRW
jgi:hypothetical protein